MLIIANHRHHSTLHIADEWRIAFKTSCTLLQIMEINCPCDFNVTGVRMVGYISG